MSDLKESNSLTCMSDNDVKKSIENKCKNKHDFFNNLFCPLESKAKNKLDVYGFDIETEHVPMNFNRKNGKEVIAWRQDFLLGSIVGDDYKKVFNDRKEMAEHLLSRRFRGSMIMATNLEFDFNQLYHDCLEKFHLIYSHGLIGAVHKGREDMHDKSSRVRKWTFVDTMNYMRVGVNGLSEVVKVNKMDYPPSMKISSDGLGMISSKPKDITEWKALEEYNVNDSMITYLFAQKMRDFCTLHNMKLKLTIGSTGMDFWRRNYQHQPLIRESEEMVMKHFQGSFKGGLTQLFKRGTYNDKMWYYDFRSSYPSCLFAGIDGKGTYPNPSTHSHTLHGTVEHIERYEGICHANIKAPYNYMPYLGMKAENGRLLMPYGSFNGWYTNFELRKAMNQGYEVEPDEMIYYYETFTPFRECVRYLYDLRKKYKEAGNEYQAMVKVLMNSGLFGKWGTNPNNMEELIPLKSIEFRGGIPYFEGRALEDVGIFDNITLFDGFATRKKPAKPFRYSFPIISEYTTALGRNKLMEQICKHPDDVVYTDTDSSVVTKPVFQEGNELGDWQLEEKPLGGLFIRAKLYEFKKDKPDKYGNEYVCKSKGVGKFMKTHELFQRAIRDECVDMERFTKMKESNRISIKSGTVMRFKKFLSFEDDKRNWLGKKFNQYDWQNSEPLKVCDNKVVV